MIGIPGSQQVVQALSSAVDHVQVFRCVPQSSESTSKLDGRLARPACASEFAELGRDTARRMHRYRPDACLDPLEPVTEHVDEGLYIQCRVHPRRLGQWPA